MTVNWAPMSTDLVGLPKCQGVQESPTDTELKQSVPAEVMGISGNAVVNIKSGVEAFENLI